MEEKNMEGENMEGENMWLIHKINPIVEVLHYTPYIVLMKAIRTSHDSTDRLDTEGNKLGDADRKLLEKIVEYEHLSTLEHVVYSFKIRNISRALLQELARHRHISMTVKSTRFTLNKEKIFEFVMPSQFIQNFQQDEMFQELIMMLVDYIAKLLRKDKKNNDTAKYLLPEAFRTELVLTVNARELLHIINLRIRPVALPEFRLLAEKLLKAVKKIHPELWELLEKRYNLSQG